MASTFSLLGICIEESLSWQGLPDWVELLSGMAIPFNSKPRTHLRGERSGGEGSTLEKQKVSRRAGGVAQRLRALAADLILMFTIPCNSNSKDPIPCFGLHE